MLNRRALKSCRQSIKINFCMFVLLRISTQKLFGCNGSMKQIRR
ncbi:hypothetical protein LUU34_01112400 [Aix galericulata]|nr:hypothetical protein LUU34_01112400 [Aix galericulata]